MNSNHGYANCRRKILRAMMFWPALTFSLAPFTSAKAQKQDELKPILQPSQQNAEHYIQRAVELAEMSLKRGDGTGYGAVVVKDNMIVGEGRNRTFLTNDPTAHSEIDAIRDACRRLDAHTLKDSEIYCSARPCQMCETACYWAQLKRIHFKAAGSNIVSIEPRYSRC